MRNIYEKTERAGHTKGNKFDINAIDYNDVPENTMRNIYEKTERAGHTKGNKFDINAIDYNDVPENTMRNIHKKTERAGHTKSNKFDTQAINYNDVPENTMRNIYEKTERAGHTKGNRFDIKAIDYNDIPEATMRSINKGEVKGHSKNFLNKQGSRKNYLNMNINGAKEALEEGRQPTKIGMNKSWSMDNTAIRLRSPLETTWTPKANSSLPYSNTQLGSFGSRHVMETKVWRNNRINMHPDLNLQGNEFVNNLIHKSI